jgi:hypothetical protein
MADSRVLTLNLRGHLTKAALERELLSLEPDLTNGSNRAVLVDCTAMQAYDLDARSTFTQWLSRHRARLSRVAIVTPNTMWHLVVSAMALASRTRLKAFMTLDEARHWLRPDDGGT